MSSSSPTAPGSSIFAARLTTDSECRFTVVSLNADRKDVGDLEQYRGLDIQLRGTIRPFQYANGNGPEPGASISWRQREISP